MCVGGLEDEIATKTSFQKERFRGIGKKQPAQMSFQAPSAIMPPAARPSPNPAAGTPMSVAPMGQWSASGNQTSPFNDSYPNNGVGLTSLGSDAWANGNMQISKLMPASWREGANSTCGDLATDYTAWAKYSPKKAQYDGYITSQASVRTPLSQRSGNPTHAMRDLLRQTPPVPLSGQSMTFGDSSQRLDLIYQSTGIYPRQTSC